MSQVASIIADLVTAGVSAELIGRVAEAIASREAVLVPDKQAEARRERDRERQRVRRHPQTSAKSADPLSKTKGFPKPLLKTQPISNTPSPLTGAHGSSFEEFWLAYPSKVGKRAAEASFLKARKRAPPPEILAGLARAKQSDRWRAGYVPNPATWLNQDRWLDEPDGCAAELATPSVYDPALAAAIQRAVEMSERTNP